MQSLPKVLYAIRRVTTQGAQKKHVSRKTESAHPTSLLGAYTQAVRVDAQNLVAHPDDIFVEAPPFPDICFVTKLAKTFHASLR